MPHVTNKRPPGDYGTADQAVTWVLDHSLAADAWAADFLRAWREGDLEEWPDFLEWLDAQPREPAPRRPWRRALTAVSVAIFVLYLAVSCALDAAVGGPP